MRGISPFFPNFTGKASGVMAVTLALAPKMLEMLD